MLLRRDTPLRRIAYINHRNQFIPFRGGEEAGQEGGVEGADPEGREAFVFGGEHEVGGDDGGIDLGAILVVVAADPGIGRTAADDEDQRRAVVRARDAPDGRQHARVGYGPYMDGLPIHRRGRNPARLQDPVDLLLLHRLRRERPAGIPVLDEGGKVHGYEVKG